MDDSETSVTDLSVLPESAAIAVGGGGVGGVQICPALMLGSSQALPGAAKHIYSRLAANAAEVDEGMPSLIISLVSNGNQLSEKYLSRFQSAISVLISGGGLWLVSSGEHHDPLARTASSAMRAVLPQIERDVEVLHVIVNSMAVTAREEGRLMVDASLNTLLILSRNTEPGEEPLFRANAVVRLAHPPPALLIGVPSENITSGNNITGTAPPILLSPSNDRRPLPAVVFAGASLTALQELLVYVENGFPVIVLQDSCELCVVLHNAYLLYRSPQFDHGKFVSWLEEQMDAVVTEDVAQTTEIVVKIFATAFGDNQLIEFLDSDEMPSLASRIIELCLQCHSGAMEARQLLQLSAHINEPAILNEVDLDDLLDDELMTAILCETIAVEDRVAFLAAVLERRPQISVTPEMLMKLAKNCDQVMVESWHEETAHASYCFEAADLPTKNVVVYSDRAEVKRVVKVSLGKGTSEIILKNVSAVIERQSVRVDGHGVLIQEVQYQEMPIDTEQENEKIRALEREKINMENERFAIEDEICSLRKRIEVLDGVAGQIAAGPPSTSSLPNEPSQLSTRRHTVIGSTSSQFSNHSASSAGFLINEEAISNLAKFLSYYSETVSNMKTSLRSRQRDLDQQSEKIEALERQIDQLRCGYEYDSVRRNITIVVEMEVPAAVELFVSYQVYCASWKPAYDIRAVTTAGGEQENKIKLCYYGLVEQNTGDDWNDTDMVLSTATPSVGGCAPQLATLSASIQRPNKNQRQRQPSARRKPLYEASEEDMGFGSYDCNEMADAAALHRFTTAQISRSSEDNSVSTPSVENLVSTCFSVPRAVTIPSNGAEHKVLIMMVDLACSYTHDCVPPRCASAFLSAVITNTTPFPLPPGDASVYLNNGFVTKTHLRAVPPGEEFCCSLGTDPSIKIDYKTPTISQEQVGFMSKSTLITHEQMISLRNAKATQAVQITVKEQIPKSTDEKIKICIVSPDVRAKHGEAKLNKDHNLEWTFVLAPGQQRDLLVKYTIEHPASEAVSFKLLA